MPRLAQRPATRRQGGARRPVPSYYSFRCAACGRQGADVAPCGRCDSVACASNAACHRFIYSNSAAHWGALDDTSLAGWDVGRGNGSLSMPVGQKGPGYLEAY